MEQPVFSVAEVWRWPSEPDTIRFIVRVNTRDGVPLRKGEIVLKQTDNPRLYKLFVDSCPPLDGSTAPNYAEPPP